MAELVTYSDGLERFPALVWRFDRPLRCVSSGPLGGGLGTASWVLNATVRSDYVRNDPAVHLAEIATSCGLDAAAGVGLMTAVDVSRMVCDDADGAQLWATVGIGFPQWAAKTYVDESPTAVRVLDDIYRPNTINIVALLPVTLSDAALINAVATVAEAKAQAFIDLGIAGTGTITDTTTLLCPRADVADGAAIEPYGGPRSTWGAWLANATHRSVIAGALADERLVDRITIPNSVTTTGVHRS